MNPKLFHSLRTLLPFTNKHLTTPLSSSSFVFHHTQHRSHHFQSHPFTQQNPNSFSCLLGHDHSLNLYNNIMPPSFHFYFACRSLLSTLASVEDSFRQNNKKIAQSDTNEEVEPIDLWEEEDEAEPKIGDGGNGGGVVLQNCPWGERALSIAKDVLLQFGDDIEIFAFKTSQGGYIYVRLDRLCNEYGCPSMEDIQSYSHEYKKKLDEAGGVEGFPSDLALEVSSPGADRLLRIPGDLERFQNMAMRVKYVEHDDPRSPGKEGIFFLESIETESGSCVWKLADVKENRDPSSKGRPMSRKQKDWRLKLPYEKLEQARREAICYGFFSYDLSGSSILRALAMKTEWPYMTDLGARSTCLMATKISVEELDSDIINVALGGKLDSDMLRVVVDLNVPFITMTGNPSTLQNELHDVTVWRIVLDPGSDFQRKPDNLDILMGLKRIRSEIARKSFGMSHEPLLVRTSRKVYR